MDARKSSLIRELVVNSNMIEREPITDDAPSFSDHLLVAEVVLGSDKYWPTPAEWIHAILMASKKDKFPGEMRQVNVWVGVSQKMSPADVRIHMPRLMSAMLAGPGDADPSVWAWDVHHYFEIIHPFWDGNGRVGRLLLNMARLHVGLDIHVVRFEDRFKYYHDIEKWEKRFESTGELGTLTC